MKNPLSSFWCYCQNYKSNKQSGKQHNAWFEVVQDLVFCHHFPQKNARGKTNCDEGPISFYLGRIESSIPLMLFMLLHIN
jgi:hypothetical protein